ncbi:hypothetical protein [Bacteroides sp.]|uniref:hypothetical protein n=1 Tax=Bacteroides sp. TaxID=29523 RepID=UPI0026184D8F|nr:hypothetical protein [Bacteroides sp.]MDD3039057.1 hypothetical protein [Bacteroides sp.]
MKGKQILYNFSAPAECPVRTKHFVSGNPICNHPKHEDTLPPCPEGRDFPLHCPLDSININNPPNNEYVTLTIDIPLYRADGWTVNLKFLHSLNESIQSIESSSLDEESIEGVILALLRKKGIKI